MILQLCWQHRFSYDISLLKPAVKNSMIRVLRMYTWYAITLPPGTKQRCYCHYCERHKINSVKGLPLNRNGLIGFVPLEHYACGGLSLLVLVSSYAEDTVE